MNESIIAGRYAKAIFQSALEKNLIERVNQDMLLISDICSEPQTKEFLSSPVIPPGRKQEVFHQMFRGRTEQLTLALTDLLVKNGRESYLPSIARIFIHKTMKHKGITESFLTTTDPVSTIVRDQIISLIGDLFKTGVQLKETTDPKILGGFILRVDDKYIDASVRNKLNKIKKGFNRSSLTS